MVSRIRWLILLINGFWDCMLSSIRWSKSQPAKNRLPQNSPRSAILGQSHDRPDLAVHQAMTGVLGKNGCLQWPQAQKASTTSQNIIDTTDLITDLSSSNESKPFLTLFILSEVMNSIILLSTLCFSPQTLRVTLAILADHDSTNQSVHMCSFYLLHVIIVVIRSFGLLPIPMSFLSHDNQKACNNSPTMTPIGYTS